ncbi:MULTISPECIES: sporulation peptidase YabG [Oceanobacillus]|uniref:Sporulation peptidase YabG n=1 Tax=Oceanobacillus kimchii TaxID=746691 RepID=A0ABQ5TDC2_9BACI|nr:MULTISPECIES: sporulation peptidase YabG [Oceanobacillus]MBT2599848.1 sporulation peptidase YabG [Oceanobacillus sp. ISL-74]MBT2652702.1 sporulation peptidase YabG [Oceanobacillus sp. ISL-73]MCT1577245.1 sporulation peptidase YabG [Oceanobacillus kimchii]MCT2135315.1 sporulation peptidase YabG [Oceanobacillus kimchii]OEH56579.1 sporulation peptidase YabG [Oceanobacillus sp. E9]
MVIANGELVTRKSYEHDLLFRVIEIKKDIAVLHGEDMRLAADAPLNDLTKVDQREKKRRKEQEKEKQETSYRLFRQDYQLMKEKRNYEATEGYSNAANYFQLPAKVLHMDGDANYLRKCIQLYQRIGLQVHGVHLTEVQMPEEINDLLERIQPDILVITGHDAYSKNKGLKNDLRAYRHSKYFVETVREARRVVPNLDQLIIFAGACQSHFESIIRAGANFASSPSRVNIHALDPVYIVAKIAYTPFMESVSVWEALRNTLTGERGLGGIETKGLLRTGMPFVEDSNEEEM